jgi:hypothetical protein
LHTTIALTTLANIGHPTLFVPKSALQSSV